MVLGHLYSASEFLDVTSYTHVQCWATMILNRPAVQRGRIVNRTWSNVWEQLPERHDAQDITDVLSWKL